MSNYENYTKTSGNYDSTRIPVGVEIITGCLAQSKVSLAQQHLLDAGCGTGNYSKALLAHLGHISAVDLNLGMLERARQKCAVEGANGSIDFYQAGIDSLPFDDATFDGIMINQVLHHLELGANDGYPAYRSVFSEFSRVLRPGGVLIVNSCSHEQLKNGFWYYDLIPGETRRMRERHAPLDVLQHIMQEVGISYEGRYVPVDALMQGDDYFNPHGPLDKNWRDGDSIWSTVSEKKLNEVKTRLNELDQSGQLENYMQENDVRREHIGQFSFLFGRRTGNRI